MTNKLVPEQELCAGGLPVPDTQKGQPPQVTASDPAKPCRTLTPISCPFPGAHSPPGSPGGSWVGGTHSGLIHGATAGSEQQPCGRRMATPAPFTHPATQLQVSQAARWGEWSEHPPVRCQSRWEPGVSPQHAGGHSIHLPPRTELFGLHRGQLWVPAPHPPALVMLS